MDSPSWGSAWKGAFQTLSMQLFSEDFSDELGAEKEEAKKPLARPSTDSTRSAPKKEYTPSELQDKMRYLMTSYPQLWKEYKEELFREQSPTNPETIRRVFIGFLDRHEKVMQNEQECVPHVFKIPNPPFGNKDEMNRVSHTTWKPGSDPSRRLRPRKPSSLVNNLKDSLHRSLHAEELSPFRQKSKLPPLASPSRRVPSRRSSLPLRQDKANRRNVDLGSEHSASSASFHEEDAVVVTRAPRRSTLGSVDKTITLPMDHAQRQLTRLQSIPHLWMMYQSERLYRQTLTGDADDVKVETDGGEESTTANTPYIPTADHSSLVEFCRKHEVEILEYEVEAEEARIAALEEEKRRKASSRIHVELNVSFHEEASARCLPKNYFSISDHEERQTPVSSYHDQAVLHQDPVQQKLSRVKQVPTLWESFQKQLENEEHPNDVETIKRVIDVFWLENERTVLQHERREASLLNTSFHEESLLPHPPFRSQKHGRQTLDSHRKRDTFFLDSTRQSFSSRSLRSIHTAVNDLTGELSPLKEKADTTGTTTTSRSNNKSSHGAGLDRRTQMLELYQKGEGFSSRSMRSVRIAIDGLAGEVDGNEPVGKKMDEKPHSAPVLDDNNATGQNVGGMFAFLASKQVSKDPIPDSGGGWLCRLSQVSALMTRDLESEITQSDACASTGTATVETKKESTVGEEEDEIFVRAAQIATARRKCPMEETITEETEPSEEEEEDPMTQFLRDPMLEVTIHNNNDTIDDETNSKPGTSSETGKEDEDSLL